MRKGETSKLHIRDIFSIIILSAIYFLNDSGI